MLELMSWSGIGEFPNARLKDFVRLLERIINESNFQGPQKNIWCAGFGKGIL